MVSLRTEGRGNCAYIVEAEKSMLLRNWPIALSITLLWSECHSDLRRAERTRTNMNRKVG